MEIAKLKDMTGGWFIGNFEPSLHKTKDFEVAVKHYKKGDAENVHYHKVATEYTLILNGSVQMLGQTFYSGDIIIIQPSESTGFEALSDVTTVVIKTPSVKDDKFIL